ncbi:MAG TPA: hypothetical protein VIY48_21720 [Candidatus Paceibacterota bacterium]
MIIFFTATLALSIVGMVGLLLLKQWELSTGIVLGGRMRPAVGAQMHRVLVWAEYQLPMLAKQWWHRSKLYGRTVVHRLTALGVVLIERGLEKSLKHLRHNTTVARNDTEASAFLREVSAHKKQLLKTTRKKAVVYEE